MERTRILLAGDHALSGDGLRAHLGSIAGAEVVGEATTGEEAVARAAELAPDVVLMDLEMPGLRGVEATRRILTRSPGVGVVVVTIFEDDVSVLAAMRAGARGYVLKGAGRDEVSKVIRAVARGEAFFGARVAHRVLGFFVSRNSPVPADAFPELTAREREVLDLIARGCNNAEIADTLYLSPKTVRNHISGVFAKLRCNDRAQAIVRAREAGYGGAWG